MIRVQRFCCCMDLLTGAKVIGVVGFVIHILVFLSLLFKMITIWLISDEVEEAFDNEKIVGKLIILLQVILVISAIFQMIAIILYYRIWKPREGKEINELYNWLLFTKIFLCVHVFIIIVLAFDDPTLAIQIAFSAIPYVYSYIVIYSLKLEVDEGNVLYQYVK